MSALHFPIRTEQEAREAHNRGSAFPQCELMDCSPQTAQGAALDEIDPSDCILALAPAHTGIVQKFIELVSM